VTKIFGVKVMANLIEIFSQISSRAEHGGHRTIAEAAREAAAHDRPLRVLVLSWHPELGSSLRDWVARQLPRSEVITANPVDLSAAPWSAASADRVLLILLCGEFLDAEQFEQAEGLVLARPA
jgi:hypothetical protein